MRLCLRVFVQCCLILFTPEAHSQNQPFAIKIRYGVLDTTSYPSANHPTEWKQELIADLYDSTGRLMPPIPGLVYVWGVDFCKGLGMGFGWVSGPGLNTISPTETRERASRVAVWNAPIEPTTSQYAFGSTNKPFSQMQFGF
jgi:hypothetical protein